MLPSRPRPAPARSRPARRRWRAACGLALALALGGCHRGSARADSYEALGDQLMAVGAYPAAVGAFSSATSYDSNEARRWLKLGRAYRALDNDALAANAYQRALELDPASVEALQVVSVSLVRDHRFDEAKRYSQPLLVLSPNDVNGLLAEGAIAFAEGNLSRADDLATQIIGLAPNLPDGYVLRARVLQSRDKPAQAMQLLIDRQKADPDNLSYAQELMTAYRRDGNLAGIRAQAITLARLKPDNVTYAMESARAFWAAGQRDRAERLVDGLATRYRNSPAMLTTIAQFWQGALPAGPATARIVALAARSTGRTRAALGQLLVDAGAVEPALRLLAPVAAQPVDNRTVDLHVAYAAALFAAGRGAEADREVKAVLAHDDANDAALLVRARARAKAGDYDNALVDAQLVASDAPTNEAAALLVPQIYAAKGLPLLAGRAYGDAQARLPDSLRVLRARVAWLQGQGQPDDAFRLAGEFAHRHEHMPSGWAAYRAACAATARTDCARLTKRDADADATAI